MSVSVDMLLRKVQLAGLLEIICQELELTDAQIEDAKEHYEAVGQWLTSVSTSYPALIYPQGSISLRTTVRPIGQEEYDVDLVCFVEGLSDDTSPTDLKRYIGDILKANGRYKDILEEKTRCWRLNYAKKFHLDITPSIQNPRCTQGGELIPNKLPDKRISGWKPTNPKGYQIWFDEHGKLQPRFRIEEDVFAKARAGIEILPEQKGFKGLLRRCVQLCKGHRNEMFNKRKDKEYAPISIILTTLVARSYHACCSSATVHESELDLLVEIVRNMHRFVEVREVGDRRYYNIPNKTTQGENFAEKWNADENLALGFFMWQKQAIGDFEKMAELSGIDEVTLHLYKSFGDSVSKRAIGRLTNAVSEARPSGLLSVVPGVGLAAGVARANAVRPNTFFGS
jgi:hypothetical protein